MEQPIPKVTEEDVNRVIMRDFGEARLPEVLAVLAKCSFNDTPRVRLAILKLANGNLETLAEQTTIASQDFRDVVAWAEYPRWSKEIGFEDVDQGVAAEVISDDWKQYCEWFGRQVEKRV